MATPAIRWLMVGEAGHGTNEIPKLAAAIVCMAIGRNRPVYVALEYAAKNQPLIDRYLDSDGGVAARKQLLTAPLWDRNWADGRSSRAMLNFIEWLRVQYRRGHVLGIVAFDADAGRGADRERQMADRLRAIATPPGGVTIVLTGAFHARKRDKELDAAPYTPAAGLLPTQSTFTVRVQGDGGQNWSCHDDRCGVHQAARTGKIKRALRMTDGTNGSYDAVLDLGAPTTASFPAVLVSE